MILSVEVRLEHQTSLKKNMKDKSIWYIRFAAVHTCSQLPFFFGIFEFGHCQVDKHGASIKHLTLTRWTAQKLIEMNLYVQYLAQMGKCCSLSGSSFLLGHHYPWVFLQNSRLWYMLNLNIDTFLMFSNICRFQWWVFGGVGGWCFFYFARIWLWSEDCVALA